MLAGGGDLALIVGGYNSSNTSHLVELCEEKMPTYYIKDEFELISRDEIRHLDLQSGQVKISSSWMPEKESVTILLSAGASCPDALVDRVINRLAALFGITAEQIERALQPYAEMAANDAGDL
jgi:4-hydroxy-3-methylbut-2-enyl diphosphate reductase